MFEGTVEELREFQEKAGALAQELARVMTELHALSPVGVAPGQIVTVGGAIVRRGTEWVVRRRP